MKKFLLKFAALVLFVGTLASCEEDKVFYDGSNGPAVAQFLTSEGSFGVSPTRTVKSIPVQVSTLSGSQRNIVVTIDEVASSPNIADLIDIDAAQSFIPANSYEGNVVIKYKKTYDDISFDNDLLLVLKLESVQGASIEQSKGRFDVTVYKSCDFTEANVGTDCPALEGDVFSAGGAQAKSFFGPEFSPKVTHSASKPNEFHFDTLWGYDFIDTFAGGTGQYHNQLLASATIIVNNDLSLKIVPDANSTYILDATGTYDACKNTFTYTLTQDIYGSKDENKVTVTLTGVPPVQP